AVPAHLPDSRSSLDGDIRRDAAAGPRRERRGPRLPPVPGRDRGPHPRWDVAVRRHAETQPGERRKSEVDWDARHARRHRAPLSHPRAEGADLDRCAVARRARCPPRCAGRRQRIAQPLRCRREAARADLEGRQGGAEDGVERGSPDAARRARAEPSQGIVAVLDWTRTLSRAEWLRLSGFCGAVALLHVLGWGLFWFYARDHPALGGLGTLAYTFGVRHAFDADHIAAIDNTTRKFRQEGRRPLGVGFFFSLGHSTIVFGLALGLAIAAPAVNSKIPALHSYGGYLGTSVSGAFLWIIGILNLLVLLDVLRVFSDMRRGPHDRDRLELRLLDRGFFSRF